MPLEVLDQPDSVVTRPTVVNWLGVGITGLLMVAAQWQYGGIFSSQFYAAALLLAAGAVWMYYRYSAGARAVFFVLLGGVFNLLVFSNYTIVIGFGHVGLEVISLVLSGVHVGVNLEAFLPWVDRYFGFDTAGLDGAERERVRVAKWKVRLAGKSPGELERLRGEGGLVPAAELAIDELLGE